MRTKDLVTTVMGLAIIVILVVGVVALATAPNSTISVSDDLGRLSDGIYLGDIAGNEVYRFRDGDTTCYLADGYEGVGITCLK